MEKILLVEDNKTLAKLISKKIEEELKIEVDVAYSLQEAKLFLSAYNYFITLLDLNLPDAPNGEVVDYALSKEQHVIVLSANIDKSFREKMLKKEIIDYVTKGGMQDIHYIISAIERLQKNKEHKVLLVDSSMITRKHMKILLENLFFNVITVAHGEEAIGMLQTHSDISLVITDYNMPVMNGLELTHEIRKTYTKEALGIIALSSNEDNEINAMFLKNGANDYIRKPFSKEEFSCRINNSIEALENIQFVTNHANRDFLTGLYNRRYFLHHMHDYIQEISLSPEQYSLALIKINNFKNINDTHGHSMGDKTIVHVSEVIRSTTSYKDIIARFDGDEFCIVLKNTTRTTAQSILNRIQEVIQKSYLVSEKGIEIQFTISIGAVLSSEDSLEENISQADMMLYKATQKGQNTVLLS